MTGDDREPPFDRAYFASYTGGDDVLANEVLDLFFDNAPSYLDALTKAEGSDDWRAAAHRLKGAARSIGARPLARAAAEAETAPRPDQAAAVERVRAELDRLRAHLGR